MPLAPNSIGKGMLTASWVLVLGLLTLFFSNFLEEKNNPNRSPKTQQTAHGVKEVYLKRNAYGHYVASGEINGHSVVFFLDTGATSVSVPEKIAAKMNLHKGQQQVASTANGTITTYSTNLHTVTLGNIELHDIEGNINPYMDEEEVLLGMSFLKHLEFTQRGDELILRQY